MVVFNWKTLAFVVIFILGTMAGMAIDSQFSGTNKNTTTMVIDHSTGEMVIVKDTLEDTTQKKHLLERLLGSGPEEVASPQDWVKEEDISVLNNRVIIKVDNPEWARFTNTNSMDPVIDEGSHAIEIVPKIPEDISVGDIVSYKSNLVEGTIIHRVVKIGYDTKGWYAIFKGDNNNSNDPEKVRFDQIKRVVIAIIY